MTGPVSRRICSAGSASPTYRRAPAPRTIWGSASSSRRACLERSGADLTFDNLVEGGAHVVISWKRANLEAEARPDAAAAEMRRRTGRGWKREANAHECERPIPAAPATEAEAPPLRGLPEAERTLLIVDDDAPLCQRLARAMERRGFVVSTADSVAAGIAAATAHPPAFAVVDLRLGDGSGLDVVSALREARPGARIVDADRLWQYRDRGRGGEGGRARLPAEAGRCRRGRARAAGARRAQTPEPPEDPMSADRVRWEHIQRVFELCDRNVSETARRLKMHRRTLQRILSKHAPRN